eukprot:3147279-Rhodomonas_salina.1
MLGQYRRSGRREGRVWGLSTGGWKAAAEPWSGLREEVEEKCEEGGGARREQREEERKGGARGREEMEESRAVIWESGRKEGRFQERRWVG